MVKMNAQQGFKITQPEERTRRSRRQHRGHGDRFIRELEIFLRDLVGL